MRAPSNVIHGVIGYFAHHRTIANILMVLLLLAGFISAGQIRSQFFPDTGSDSISLSIAWPGAGAADVDHAIVAVVDPVLRGIDGVLSTSSVASEGSAQFTIEFEPEWDIIQAADDVNTALDSIKDLPETAEDPVIRRSQWSDRVTDVIIYGPVDLALLTRISDELEARLLERGITDVSLSGVVSSDIQVEVSEIDLIRHDITLSKIAEVIGEEVNADPAGEVSGGNFRIRTGSEKRNSDELSDIVVEFDAKGQALRLGDVAKIQASNEDDELRYFHNGQPAISMRVQRSKTGDAIAIQHRVEKVVDELQAELPQDVKIELIRTLADDITQRLSILAKNGAMGLVLVLAFLFLFLNARIAVWVALGLPVSMAAAIFFMYMAGLTINMVSLFALIICLGIVVDDAIIVAEHADARARHQGEGPLEASENAAIVMAAPVFSSTLTTIIAFVGLAIIGGTFGRFIADIPFTVTVVLLASLVECFLILPNHLAHGLAGNTGKSWINKPNRMVLSGVEYVRSSLYRPFLRLILKLRYPTVAAVICLLAIVISMFMQGQVTWRFFNAPESNNVSGNFVMLDGATRQDSYEMTLELERAVNAVAQKVEEEQGINPLKFVLTQIGTQFGRSLNSAENKPENLKGGINIELIDADLRPDYSSEKFLADLRDELNRPALLEEFSFRSFRSGPGGDAVSVEFSGGEASVLKEAAEALKTALANYPEISGLDDTMPYDKAEYVLELTPLGHALGFSIDALGREIRNRLSGIEAADFPQGNRTATITVLMPEEERASDSAYKMRMRAQNGSYVRLADIVEAKEESGFSRVLRENGVAVITVTADLSDDNPARAAEIMRLIETQIAPEIADQFGLNFTMAGLSEEEDQFLNQALFGFSLALLGIYIVLAWIFSSWFRPIIVMSVIPFGLIGTIWGHYIWETPLSMFTVVGLLGMTGIIINDSIVLIGTINEYAKTRPLYAAILDGAVDRLRAVFLTTATTVAGLAPLLYETSRQAQFLKPTVITLVYGLGFGMVLVLIVVPTFMAIGQDFGRIKKGFWRSLKAKKAPNFQKIQRIGSLAVFAALSATMGYWAVTRSTAPLLPEFLFEKGLSAALASLFAFLIYLLIILMGMGGAALSLLGHKPRGQAPNHPQRGLK